MCYSFHLFIALLSLRNCLCLCLCCLFSSDSFLCRFLFQLRGNKANTVPFSFSRPVFISNEFSVLLPCPFQVIIMISFSHLLTFPLPRVNDNVSAIFFRHCHSFLWHTPFFIGRTKIHKLKLKEEKKMIKHHE